MGAEFIYKSAIAISIIFLLSSCEKAAKVEGYRPRITATTEIIADAVKNLGGEFASVQTAVYPGKDPHTYKAGENDVIKTAESNLVVYNGFYLEGRLRRVLKKINSVATVTDISAGIPKNLVISSVRDGPHYDPHFWMDPSLWRIAVSYIADSLANLNPINERIYRKNEERYIMDLIDLDKFIRSETAKIPEEKRILVTAHDAFSYFGKAYGFKTASLQGADTGSEISSADVEAAADFIITNGAKTIFAEKSVPIRNMKILQAALKARGYEVSIGGSLYSDTLEGKSYTEMMEHNVGVITQALIKNNETQENY